MNNIGKVVLIRSYASGVHFGTVKHEEFTVAGKVVILTNARRVHYWEGAASLSQMAMEGIKKLENSRIAMNVDEIEVVNVIETMPMSPSAIENLSNAKEWKV